MKQKRNYANLSLIIGILGFVSGITLLVVGDNWVIGSGGSIASAGIAYQGYRDSSRP